MLNAQHQHMFSSGVHACYVLHISSSLSDVRICYFSVANKDDRWAKKKKKKSQETLFSGEKRTVVALGN